MPDRKQLIAEMVKAGRRIARLGLVTARAGNISCRLDAARILITASGSALGSLTPKDIVTVELKSGRAEAGRPSSELPLHRRIYLTYGDPAVVHCHPSLANAYFCTYPKLKFLTFESRYYLMDVPVVRQKTLTVTRPQRVAAAMKKTGIAVVRNHGVFSRGPSLLAALEKIEILEEAVKVYAVARLLGRKRLDALDKELKKSLAGTK
jgi:L-fuculose-phosphate aldolase